MPRTVGHVPAPKPGQGATLDIPQAVKDEADELYNFLRENTNEEGFVEFAHESGTEWDKLNEEQQKEVTKERDTWLRHIRAYASTRQAGALKFRQLPSKHLPANQVRFSLTADLPKNGNRNQTETDKSK